jgi:hypothetical protein
MAKYEMYRGDYRVLNVTVPEPKNVNAKVHFAVKSSTDVDAVDLTDGTALFTITADSTVAIDNGDGTTTYPIIIDGTKTAGKTPGKYKAEVEYINALSQSSTFPHIDYVLKGDINQRP